MSRARLVLLMTIGMVLLSGSSFLSEPWKQKAQEISGRIECEFYDASNKIIV